MEEILRDEGMKFYQTQNSGKRFKLSGESLRLMQKWCENPTSTSSHLNKQISKLVGRDIYSLSTHFIKKAFEPNWRSKVFVRWLSCSYLMKFTTFNEMTSLSRTSFLCLEKDPVPSSIRETPQPFYPTTSTENLTPIKKDDVDNLNGFWAS